MNVESIPFFQGWSIVERDHDQPIFPNEILFQILNYLPVEDAISKGLVSYQFYCITKQMQQDVNTRLNKACNEIIAYIQNSQYRLTKPHLSDYDEKSLVRLFKFDFTSFYKESIQDILLKKIYNGSNVDFLNSQTFLFTENPNSIVTEHHIIYYPGKLTISVQFNCKKELRLLGSHILSTINQERFHVIK